MAEMRPIMTPLRRDNQELNIAEFSQGATVLRSRPLMAFVELTQNCNLSCPMCRSADGYKKEWDMEGRHFDILAEEVFPSALMVDLRGFGESTLVKDFPRLVHRTLATGVRLRLVTNGQVNRPEVWDEMMAYSSVVAVSCDAASDELFATLRQGGRLDRLKRTVGTLVEARNRHGADADCVVLTAAVSRPNLEELPALVRMAYDLDVTKVVLFPIVVANDHPWNLRGDLAGTVTALDRARAEAENLGVTLQLGAAPDPALAVDSKVKGSCMHPWAYAYVAYSGRVGFCDHLIGAPEYLFESLDESAFHEIWNGRRFQSLRRAHASKAGIPDEFAACRWCFKSRYVDFEELLHPNYADNLVRSGGPDTLYQIHSPAERPAVMFG